MRSFILLISLMVALLGCSKRERVGGDTFPTIAQFTQGSACQSIVSNVRFNTIQIMSDPDCGYLGETIEINDNVLTINNGIQALEWRVEPKIFGVIKYYSLLSAEYLNEQRSQSTNGLVELEVPRLIGGFGDSETSIALIINNQWYHIPKEESGIFTFCYDGTNVAFEVSGVVLGNSYHECPFMGTIRGHGKVHIISG